MQYQQYRAEIRQKRPIRPRLSPLPKPPGPFPRACRDLERHVRCDGGAVRERNVQAQDVDDDHEEGLDEQAGAEVRAEPVEDFEHGGDEHDERNV